MVVRVSKLAAKVEKEVKELTAIGPSNGSVDMEFFSVRSTLVVMTSPSIVRKNRNSMVVKGALIHLNPSPNYTRSRSRLSVVPIRNFVTVSTMAIRLWFARTLVLASRDVDETMKVS
jgi:hypothetical protein